MKMKKIVAITSALLVMQTLTVKAEDLFHLMWRGSAITKDSNGRIVAYPLSELQFVAKIAADTGQSPNQLMFVYRPNKHDTVVVNTVTGWFADILQMEYQFTDV